MSRLKYFVVTLIALWIVVFWVMFKSNSEQAQASVKKPDSNEQEYQNRNDQDIKWVQRIKRAEAELRQLEKKNQDNELLIQQLNRNAKLYLQQLQTIKASISNSTNSDDRVVSFSCTKCPASIEKSQNPSTAYEETRRKVFADVKEASFYINAEIDALITTNQADGLKAKFAIVKSNFQARMNVLFAQLYNLSVADHHGRERQRRAAELAQRVRERFVQLQNPSDCGSAKKIICDLNKACGFGCQMHHVMYCFITAYFTNRTLILESNEWRYNTVGYEAYFKSLSETCRSTKEDAIGWNDPTSSYAQAIKMPIIDVITNKPLFLPLSVPREYMSALSEFHGDPFTWWAGQMLAYLMRFNAAFETTVADIRRRLKFRTPCVGVHVRRSDKVGTEAAYHSLDEYMKHVDEFFSAYELTNLVPKNASRAVYLATDEVSVLMEAKLKYPHYTFVFDESNARSASVHQRYSPDSAQGVILDIYFLSQCDFLVCTFSSQVCRLAYELMQTRYPDATWRFRSLDDVYYYGGQNGHNVVALFDHVPRRDLGEIELRVGDLVGLAGNHWNGYSKGKNHRTNEEGLFPSYKTKDVIQSF